MSRKKRKHRRSTFRRRPGPKPAVNSTPRIHLVQVYPGKWPEYDAKVKDYENGHATMSDLVQLAGQLCPDHLVVGECLDPRFKAFMGQQRVVIDTLFGHGYHCPLCLLDALLNAWQEYLGDPGGSATQYRADLWASRESSSPGSPEPQGKKNLPMRLTWVGNGRDLCLATTGREGSWPPGISGRCPECGRRFVPTASLAVFERDDGDLVACHRSCVGLAEDISLSDLRSWQEWRPLDDL